MTVQQLEYVNKFLQTDNPQAKELTLTLMGLDDDGLDKVMQIIKEVNLHKLTSLSFTNGRITNDGLKYFDQLPKQVKFVDLSRNNLQEGAASILTEVFKTVDHLILNDNQLTNVDIEYFSIHSTQIYLLAYHNRDTSSELAFELDKKLYQNRVLRNKKNGNNAVNLSDLTPFWTLPAETLEEIHATMLEQASCVARVKFKIKGQLNFVSSEFKPH